MISFFCTISATFSLCSYPSKACYSEVAPAGVWDKHLNRQRDLAGSFENMSTMISKGKAAAIASTSCWNTEFFLMVTLLTWERQDFSITKERCNSIPMTSMVLSKLLQQREKPKKKGRTNTRIVYKDLVQLDNIYHMFFLIRKSKNH